MIKSDTNRANMKKQKSLPKLKKELWKWFSLYVKLKYSLDGENCRCYTCGKPLKIGTSNCHAGHYLNKTAYPALYFNENNVRPQCGMPCNGPRQGSPIEFREHLISEIGLEDVHDLERRRHDIIKWVRSNYMEKIEYYRGKIEKFKSQF